jgi:hypothetical protein
VNHAKIFKEKKYSWYISFIFFAICSISRASRASSTEKFHFDFVFRLFDFKEEKGIHAGLTDIIILVNC